MDYDELRPLTLLALRQTRATQILLLIDQVEKLALEKGFYLGAKEWSHDTHTWHKMPKEDQEKVREIIHEFILEGILM